MTVRLCGIQRSDPGDPGKIVVEAEGQFYAIPASVGYAFALAVEEGVYEAFAGDPPTRASAIAADLRVSCHD